MKNPLSPNEFKIMQLLWKEDRPLSRPEIIEMIPDRDWNPNSIHLILNNMIEKGVIRVEGMTRCGRGYGRTYAATVSNLLDDGVRPETLKELKTILAAR